MNKNEMPEWMQTDEMRQAMTTLEYFSENEQAYQIYQARREQLNQQRVVIRRLNELQAVAEQAQVATEQAQMAAEQARVAAEQERAEKEAALEREAAALAEIARLRCLLADKPGD